MPRINILKVDRPKCEHCGNNIDSITYCEIETATGKIIKMHQKCAVDFAVSIIEATRNSNLRRYTEEELLKAGFSPVIKKEHMPMGYLKKQTPLEKEETTITNTKDASESGEYVNYGIVNTNVCDERCAGYYYNKKEDIHECSIAYCPVRNGCENCDSYYFNLNTQRHECRESRCKDKF